MEFLTERGVREMVEVVLWTVFFCIAFPLIFVVADDIRSQIKNYKDGNDNE